MLQIAACEVWTDMIKNPARTEFIIDFGKELLFVLSFSLHDDTNFRFIWKDVEYMCYFQLAGAPDTTYRLITTNPVFQLQSA